MQRRFQWQGACLNHIDRTAHIFAKLMMSGKLKAAIRLISEDKLTKVLNLDDNIPTSLLTLWYVIMTSWKRSTWSTANTSRHYPFSRQATEYPPYPVWAHRWTLHPQLMLHWGHLKALDHLALWHLSPVDWSPWQATRSASLWGMSLSAGLHRKSGSHIQATTGALQLCAAQEAGIEAAILPYIPHNTTQMQCC